MTPPKILPPHYFFASIALMLLLSWLVDGDLLASGWAYLGLLPVSMGLVIAIFASNQFRKADTNLIPLTESTTLVTDGMFRFTRNPMYLGMLLFLFGVVLLTGEVSNLLVLVMFFLIIRFAFIAREEVLMEQTFGDDYVAYKDSVRRWI